MPGFRRCGPGFKTPLAAMRGPKEKLVYVLCIQPDKNAGKADYLATVDADPFSPTYSQVIHRLYGVAPGDEFHHFGWNACSSCYHDPTKSRDKLIIPGLGSDRIYIVDTSLPHAPELYKVIEPEEMHRFGVTAPHTSHCLANGDVMISTMGDLNGDPKGEFLLLDSRSWELKGVWSRGVDTAKFGYDYWYQPYWDVMVSSEFAAPKSFWKGFSNEEIFDTDLTGRSLNFFSWKDHTLKQTIDLGVDGITPLEVRFLHNPKEAQGFVGCALNANVFRFFRRGDGSWDVQKAIDVPAKKVQGWVNPEMNGMTTDILISLDDRFLYLSNWFHGDIRQYDISEPCCPKLVCQLFISGSTVKGGSVTVTQDPEHQVQRDPTYIKGKRVYGGPQMMQLSLDGKRLYVTTSLLSPWDKQFYPDMVQNGSALLKVDVNTREGGLVLDENFLVDFGCEPGGPVLAHECRFPGGDCTSDIWLADTECCH